MSDNNLIDTTGGLRVAKPYSPPSNISDDDNKQLVSSLTEADAQKLVENAKDHAHSIKENAKQYVKKMIENADKKQKQILANLEDEFASNNAVLLDNLEKQVADKVLEFQNYVTEIVASVCKEIIEKEPEIEVAKALTSKAISELGRQNEFILYVSTDDLVVMRKCVSLLKQRDHKLIIEVRRDEELKKGKVRLSNGHTDLVFGQEVVFENLKNNDLAE